MSEQPKTGMTRVKVKVTREDINEGDRKYCLACPEALATHRATGNPRIKVCSEFIVIWASEEVEIVSLPCEIIRRIRHFDDSGEMEPHEWDIDVPDDWVKGVENV